MQQFGIPVLPHIVNACLLTSAFSAGNGYFFAATRTLYGLALHGKAPRVFSKTTKAGIPIYCIAMVLAIGLLGFLQVSNGSAKVLSWMVSLVRSLSPSLSSPFPLAHTSLPGHRRPAAQLRVQLHHLPPFPQGLDRPGHAP
jgi:amino acid transporter